VAQCKNYPFGIGTTIKLNSTSDNSGI